MRYCTLLLTLLFIACRFLTLSADDLDPEYAVELGSQSALHPTVILPIPPEDCVDISHEYVQALLNILAFDMNSNGMMTVLDPESTRKVENLLRESPSQLPVRDLQEIPVSFLILPKLQKAEFSLQVTSLSDGIAQSFSPIPLTGSIAIDRRRIHQLSDFVFLKLFDMSGIATTRILYSKRFTSKVQIHEDKKKSTVTSTAEIFLCDYDGGNEKQVTALKSVSVTPQWLPPLSEKPGAKSQSFLFVSYLIGQPKLYILSLKDGKMIRLSKMRGNQLTPAVSRDGRYAAFCSDILGSSDLYMLAFDPSIGEVSKPRQVYKTPSCATGCPAFSPDGKKIAFVSNKDGSPKIYVMDIPSETARLKDLKPRLITKRCRENTAPSWSPDGKKIAYTARTSGDRQIWVYDVESEREYQLTQGPGNKENPSWAPNSLHLAYQGMRNNKWEIFIINLNQKTPIKITSGSGDKQFPAWEPRNNL